MTKDIKRFNITLPLDSQMIHFDLHPVNIREKQLYQVYTRFGDREYRFHMQTEDGKNFRITDRISCPNEYINLESSLSEAIYNS